MRETKYFDRKTGREISRIEKNRRHKLRERAKAREKQIDFWMDSVLDSSRVVEDNEGRQKRFSGLALEKRLSGLKSSDVENPRFRKLVMEIEAIKKDRRFKESKKKRLIKAKEGRIKTELRRLVIEVFRRSKPEKLSVIVGGKQIKKKHAIPPEDTTATEREGKYAAFDLHFNRVFKEAGFDISLSFPRSWRRVSP